MQPEVEKFVQLKKLAIVGASRSGNKFGNTIMTELKTRGYQTSIVHPEATEIGGQKCYPNLAALRGQVDGVVVCVPPAQAEKVVDEAVKAGIKNIWLQQGAESAQAVALGKQLDATVVSGKCILMYAPPVTSFHRFHRGFMKIIGQL
jgi:uncharacterized protein